MAATSVENLQAYLNKRGANVDVDGIMGPQTAGAVSQFQKNNGLPVTGKPDEATIAALLAPPPAPNMRPPPDQLGTGNLDARPRLRPSDPSFAMAPGDALATGNTDARPRLRPTPITGGQGLSPGPNPPQPVTGGQGVMAGPVPPPPPRPNTAPPGAQVGAPRGVTPLQARLRFDQANNRNPDMSYAPGTTMGMVNSLDKTKGARSDEAIKRYLASPDDGGMGQRGIPPATAFDPASGDSAGVGIVDDTPEPGPVTGDALPPEDDRAAAYLTAKNGRQQDFGAPAAPADAPPPAPGPQGPTGDQQQGGLAQLRAALMGGGMAGPPPGAPPAMPMPSPSPMAGGPPPPAGPGGVPSDQQKSAAMDQLRAMLGGAGGGAPPSTVPVAAAPQFTPTPDNPGYGLPGLPPSDSFAGAVGNAAGAAGGGVQGMIAALMKMLFPQPANAQPPAR